MVAETLDFTYVDTGAMYRAVTYDFISSGISLGSDAEISTRLSDMTIELYTGDRGQEVLLRGMNVTPYLRTPEVNELVSEVAAISAVRRRLVEQQQQLGEKQNVVMDGRDIGTVVFPSAKLKIYLNCNLESRIDRRLSELLTLGQEITDDEVRENLMHRDHIDSTRIDSPLRKAEDAILLDNSKLTLQETHDRIIELLESASK